MHDESYCIHCETEDSSENVTEEDWTTIFCYECGTLEVINPQDEGVSSDKIPSHLINKLLN